MFTTFDHGDLRRMLDLFAVPMFAAERDGRDQPIRYIGVNSAHSRVSGLTHDCVRGRRPKEVMPGADGAMVEERLTSCLARDRIVTHHETLQMAGRPTHWQTTLVPAYPDDSRERVVGTALPVGQPVAFNDPGQVEFCAAQAQMQLGHLKDFFAQIESEQQLPDDTRASATIVAGLVRSIDHLLCDLRLATRASRPHPREARPLLRVVN